MAVPARPSSAKIKRLEQKQRRRLPACDEVDFFDEIFDVVRGEEDDEEEEDLRCIFNRNHELYVDVAC
jgi:hypothetical protein